MMNVPENELFSAYVDGELTAAEQAEVERLLATSPAARQLVEDLRALSSTLQCLPARKLDEDLTQQVLRLAEHRVLSGRGDSEPFAAEPVATASRWRAIARRLSRPRIWVWPGLAVAVSLLLMVLQPEQAQRFGERPAERVVALSETAAPRAAAEMPAIGAADDADRDGRADVMLKRARPADRTPEESVGRMALTSIPAEAKKDAARGLTPPAAMPTAPPAPAAPSSGRPMKSDIADQPADVRPAKEGTMEFAKKAPEEVTVVFCDVTQEAMDLQVIEKALSKRQIVLLDRPAKAGGDRGGGVGGRLAQVELERLSELAAREAHFAERDDRLKARLGMAGDSGKIVYLRAEATPAQLEAVLVDLRSQPKMVRSLSRKLQMTGPVADGAVQSFSFGRGESALKQKGEAALGQPPAGRSAKRDAAGASQDAESLERFRANVQDQPAEAQSAAGARDAAQTQRMLRQPAMANTVQSDPAANRLKNEQEQRRASGKPEREGQALNAYGQMRQKALDATQATSTRPAGPSAKKANHKAGQVEEQSDESLPHPSAKAIKAPAQQAMPGQAGAMPGYGSPTAANAEGKPLWDVSAEAKAQPDVKRPVVFVLRAVGPSQIAADKPGKSPAADANAAPAKSAPVQSEAAKPAEPAKPAAVAEPGPAAPK